MRMGLSLYDVYYRFNTVLKQSLLNVFCPSIFHHSAAPKSFLFNKWDDSHEHYTPLFFSSDYSF